MQYDHRPEIPRPVRLAVLRRAGGRCEGCGQRLALELHHLRYTVPATAYDVGGGPIFGKEAPQDLEALCRDCHHGRHIGPDGKFWRDPEEMADTFSRLDGGRSDV